MNTPRDRPCAVEHSDSSRCEADFDSSRPGSRSWVVGVQFPLAVITGVLPNKISNGDDS